MTDCYEKLARNESTTYCCLLNAKSGDPASTACKIDIALDNKQTVFACVFQDVPEGDTTSTGGTYAIAKEAENTGKVYASYKGATKDITEDYMIRVFNHKFNTILSGTKIFKMTAEEIKKADIKPGVKTVIAIKADSDGAVTFGNLKAQITTASGPGIWTSFNPVVENPPSINYTGMVTIPLSLFDIVTAPSDIDTGYTIQAGLQQSIDPDDVIYSDEAEFNVIEGPEARIRIDNPMPSIGDSIKFDGAESVPRNTTKGVIPISTYTWTFGDNSTATGASATHVYTTEGRYRIDLVVIDKDGIGGRSSIVVNVEPVSGSIADQLNKSLAFIEEARANIANSKATVRETAEMLGITK
ncbi:MAG: PKD domain-containing protein, partial [Nanoarchaeota archaeon]|nr:PKD domain-containing protein [Nanoarchaeota archaeon]